MIGFDEADRVSRKIGRMLRVWPGKQLPDWFLGTGVEKRRGRGNWFVSVRVERGCVGLARYHLKKPRGAVAIDGVPVVFMIRKMARAA